MAGSGRLGELAVRSRATLADRWERVCAALLMAVQAGLAAGIAWFVVHNLMGQPSPFFAPIAAVIVLGASVGQRLRRAVELLAGVALGILVGDAVIAAIGSGAWQVGLGVSMAMLAAVFLGGGPVVVVQAASTGVLIATFAAPTGQFFYSRFFDALIGGLIGVLVMALLLPMNPFSVVRRAARPALSLVADGLRDCAAALAERDRRAAADLLGRLREGEAVVQHFREALDAARETAAMAPARWRHRAPLTQYVDAQPHIERAVGDCRGLARRAVSVLTDAEPVPAELPEAIRLLADAVDALRDELAAGTEPRRARERAMATAGRAGAAYRAGVGFSGGVVVAQIRATVTDLLRATGLDQTAAESVVRRAVGGTRAGDG
ncbi:FUSC family protein [Catellatospora sichuanensis]|uniref:FUSC family protein n=1 Tax=Catellatospora sichuanensis TaxID=1969805 RepID=UPI001182841F|nr:FUSC family protein [Catellatospora sichuanensis]